MAEARREEEEEEEWRDMRDIRNRNQATDRSERTKPDHLHSSQGPLSSIRAAIKRTRTNSQTDHSSNRRRPEITIVSAEPLASNNWFPGSSGVFPPPSQSSWSGSIQAVSQPPPSYDQVIKEKTQEEHIVKPTAAPRRSACTTTSATQTDPVREASATTVPQCSAAPQPIERHIRVIDVKKPKKPPRPSFPKPLDRESVVVTAAPKDRQVATNTTASTNTENQSDSKSDVERPNPPDSTHTRTRSVTVQWEVPTKHLAEPLSTSINSPSTAAETTPPSTDSEHTQRPTPLPRSKSRKQPITEEVKVQTLVRLSENGDSVQVTSSTDLEDVSSSKYLKELLEVFSVDNQCEQSGDTVDQSDESEPSEDAGGEMSDRHSQRNIRAKIQAFEIQASAEEELAKRPEPRPRNVHNKPPVAAKPSLVHQPAFNYSIGNDNHEVSSTNIPQSPTPAPRPQPPKKPMGLSLQEEPVTLPGKVAILPPSRPSILARAKSFQVQEEETPAGPPTPPVKPFKEPLKPNFNLNNHNSTSMITENEYVDSPSNHTPVKPQRNVDSSFGRQSVTRRPTTIRIPSKTGRNESLDGPPPLPSQRPVGSLTSSVSHKQSPIPVFPSQESFDIGPEPSLPPRPSGGKAPPPRPPPAKPGPGRPPPPRLDAAGRSRSTPSSPWEASPKPQSKAQPPRTKRKGPALPPRPNPGHRLYNKYTLELPHGIAAFDYNGSNTGELTFQKNEVLLLLEEIDHRTFQCQVGDTRGRVQKSHMKVITPLAPTSPPQGASPAGSGRDSSGLKVQAIHDFTAEGPGELGLRAGDVVSMVEQVDNDWYRGTCRGSAGFFPINYVKVLSNSPKPMPEKTGKPPSATVSGPRCVARFEFEGEHSDELSFSEGDVIKLKEYVGQDWARGQIGVFTGIFPLNFVEIVEDLPPPPTQQQHTQPTKIALPGMVAPPSTQPEVAKPAQASQSGVEWAVALYDFSGQTDGDLSFQQGDRILITQHIDAEWCCGRLNGREGFFPKNFVESSTGQLSAPDSQQSRAAGAGTAKALFDFTSDCDEELSLQAGDIVTNLESIDDEWFLGDLRGKRALVPKNYVQVLG
uniref:SH3 domain-containing protein 19 n=1 Tax=Centroberyx gerrardi TaxID=166262 RepID=UPI003AAE72FE